MASTPEQRAKWREKARRQYAAMTPERKAQKLAASRENARRRYYADVEKSRAEHRLKARERYAAMTPEEHQERRQRDRERYLHKRDTPEFQARRAAWVRRTPQPRTPSAVERDRRSQPERNARMRVAQTVTREKAARHHRPWTAEEDATVLQPLPVIEIAIRLGRTYAAVVSRRNYLKENSHV